MESPFLWKTNLLPEAVIAISEGPENKGEKSDRELSIN